MLVLQDIVSLESIFNACDVLSRDEYEKRLAQKKKDQPTVADLLYFTRSFFQSKRMQFTEVDREKKTRETEKHSQKKPVASDVRSSIEVDLSWVQPGVNVLVDSGDEDRPFVAKVLHVNSVSQQVQVKHLLNL